MKTFAAIEQGLLDLCEQAVAANDKEAHAALFEAMQLVRRAGGWRAFPFTPSRPAANGSRSTNAERQARLRERRRNASGVTFSVTPGVTLPVTDGVTSNASGRYAVTAHASPLLSVVENKTSNIPENTEAETREGVTQPVTPSVTRNGVTPKALRGTRCTIDYTPKAETVEALKSQGHKDPLSLLQDFRLYWVPLTGSNATKLDWDLTFTRWVQRERPKGNRSGTFGRIVQSAAADFSDFDNAGTPT